LVELAADVVGDAGAPVEFLAEGDEVVLQELEDGTELEFGVAEEAEEEFHGAVAGAAAEAGHGGVYAVGAVDDAFDGVGEGELEVVVHVEADFFFGVFAGFEVLLDEHFDLLGVEGAVGVDDDEGVGGGFGEDIQGLIEFGFLDGGDGHEVGGDFVAHVLGVLDHLGGFGDLGDVEGDADEIDDAFVFGDDVVLPVALAAGVGHDGEFEGLFGFADDAADGVFLAEAPVAVLAAGEEFAGGAVADFHVIDAGGDAGVVDGADDVVVEAVVVDEAAVADGAVERTRISGR